MATTKSKSKARPKKPTYPVADNPSPLQRLLVSRGLKYDEVAVTMRKLVKKGEKVSISSGYLSKVANGQTPSLKLARVIIRWARSLKPVERITLADLGVEIEP
jgi:hypothetical protein